MQAVMKSEVRAAQRPNLTALSSESTRQGERGDPIADLDLLQMLQGQLAVHGVALTAAAGGVLLTGADLCQFADTRSAWLLLRHLERSRRSA